MSTLRQQIKSLPTYEGEWVLREHVLDIIDRYEQEPQNIVAFVQLPLGNGTPAARLEVACAHPAHVWTTCVPDRERLVRAIADISEVWAESAEWLAGRIIERLEDADDPTR